MARFVRFGLAAALAAPLPASAMPPPLPVNARYGPVTQCLNGYRIAVTDREAVSVGAEVTLITDHYLLRLIDSAGSFGESTVSPVVHPGLGRIERVVTKVVRDRDNGGFRVIGPQPKQPKFTVAYRLPALDANRPVAVTSPQFQGTDADLAMLSRVARVDPAADSCGAFAAPDFAGQNYDALRWSPALTAGPAFRCQNGIGYAVEAGERLRLYWGPNPDTGISEIYRGERRFGIRGPIDPAKKLGRGKGLIAAGYTIGKRPLGAGMSELILSPPNNAKDRPFLREVYIPHNEADEAEARAFAGRLEFVSDKDRRCKR